MKQSDLSVLQVLAGLRARTMGALGEVARLAETEIADATRSVGNVVDVATRHVQRVKDLAGRLDGSDREGIANAVARQGKLLQLFLGSVSRDIECQEEAADRVQGHLLQISKVVSATGKLASSARLLALNARIEASRLTGQDLCFATIAEEMQQLAEQITQANESIDHMASAMLRDLPAVAESAKALRKSSEGLTRDLSKATDEVQRESNAMQDLLRQLTSQSDEEMEVLIASLHAALSHLQFGETVSRSLSRVEEPIYQAQLECSQILEVDDAESVIAPLAGGAGGAQEASEEVVDAGEVVLF